ncbi:cyclic peptide export ABC transporter [Candidatus Methylomicrobium oryzae]|jgi:putative ATP-binding cassette transporter|uniref:cyclic peptide export ABC transporter n=1 Tax=Candidatus Methylomicrobium oryzae TaxID=2802053 RepID=UPI001923989C|nr:cyclic peptide export ABC transporter [Methylomicrobium sp. RS1]MBL1264300.1 cyclic peptide export ABC transporter [Methylomicrobium sp. RS1]
MLLFLWRSSWITITGVLLTGAISGLSNAALIAFINTSLVGQKNIPYAIGWFAGLALTVLASRTASLYLLNRFSTQLVRDLRLRISRLILNAPYPNLQKMGKSALLSHLTEDVTAIASASELFPVLCINFAILVGCMTYLSWLSWQLALVLAGIILFGMTTFNFFKDIPLRSVRIARGEYDVLGRGFTALTEGVRELKLHRRRSEAFVSQSLSNSAEAYRRHSFRAAAAYLWLNQWIQLLYYLTIGAILYAFPLWQTLNQEIISGYVLVFLFMMSPLTIVTNSLPAFSRAKVSLDKILQLDEKLAERSLAERPAGLALQKSFTSLTLTGVTHSFHREKENRNFTLGPINLEFHPGELVFLVGGNGSGKTTLAMLLIGLYHPASGMVSWNGCPVDGHNRDAYMQNFSVIFSDFYLFDELYGVDAVQHRDAVDDYLQRLHLNHKVEIINGRFSSVSLSQGQRKRLALLVAYLEDRPFYVFDEWAADQDPEFKHVFYTELLPALKARGKTVLAITHDEKYFYLADRCIKLDEGNIAAIEYPQGYAGHGAVNAEWPRPAQTETSIS